MITIWLLIWLGVALIVAALFGAVVSKHKRDIDRPSRTVSRIRRSGF